MKRVYAKHLPYKNGHYSKVFHEMTLNNDGPIIKVLETGNNEFCAVEGSHRLASAYFQKKVPRLIVVEPDGDGLPDEYWNKIKETLPVYEFETAMVMREKDFYV